MTLFVNQGSHIPALKPGIGLEPHTDGLVILLPYKSNIGVVAASFVNPVACPRPGVWNNKPTEQSNKVHTLSETDRNVTFSGEVLSWRYHS